MSIVTSIIEKLRTKRREELRSVLDQYRDFVDKMAAGQEVDLDALGYVLDELGKSYDELNLEVENKAARRPLVAQLDEKRLLEADLPRLYSEFEMAKQRLEEATKPLQEAINKAWDAVRSAENRLLQLSGVEGRLIHSCRDPEILERESQLSDRRKELNEANDQYLERRRWYQSELIGAKHELGNIQLNIDQDNSMPAERKNLRSAEQKHTNALKALNDFDSQNAWIREGLAEVDRIQRELNESKLRV